MHRDKNTVVALEVLAFFGATHPTAAKHIRYEAASTGLPLSMQTVASKWHFFTHFSRMSVLDCSKGKLATKGKKLPEKLKIW